MATSNEKPATKPARKRTTVAKKPKASPTGRVSVDNEPNVQNVPVRTEEGATLKAAVAKVSGMGGKVNPTTPPDPLTVAKATQATILHGLASSGLTAEHELAVAYNVLVAVLYKNAPAGGRGKWRHKACKELNERLVKALVS